MSHARELLYTVDYAAEWADKHLQEDNDSLGPPQPEVARRIMREWDECIRSLQAGEPYSLPGTPMAAPPKPTPSGKQPPVSSATRMDGGQHDPLNRRDRLFGEMCSTTRKAYAHG